MRFFRYGRLLQSRYHANHDNHANHANHADYNAIAVKRLEIGACPIPLVMVSF